MNPVAEVVKKTKQVTQGQTLELGPKEKICSSNIKTGHSINFPIWKTCRPTSVCSKLCYGAIAGRPITWTASLQKFMKNYRYFMIEDPVVIAERIYKEYKSKKMSWLRWNGVGDLFPQAIPVINHLVENHPDVTLLVVTRKPEMVQDLSRTAKNLYIMFSLDGSKLSIVSKQQVDLQNHPRLYYSYLRQTEEEDTKGSSIIFNMQQKKKELPYEDKERVCPVDAGVIPLERACESCRKCFSSQVLNYQKES
jgi:hypothetical protein